MPWHRARTAAGEALCDQSAINMEQFSGSPQKKTVLSDRYMIGEELGRGAYGQARGNRRPGRRTPHGPCMPCDLRMPGHVPSRATPA